MAFLRKNILKAGFIFFVVLFFGSFGQEASAVALNGACTGGAINPGTGICKPVDGGASSCAFSNVLGVSDCGIGLICCKNAVAPPACASPNSCVTASVCPSGPSATGTCPSGQVCCQSVASGGGMPSSGGGGMPPASSQAIEFKNPLQFETVEQVLGSLLDTLRGLIVLLSLVFIVIGAVLYITSAGDEGRMKTAKGAITASMIGLAIGLAAPSFLKEIGTVLGWGPAVDSSAVDDAQTLSQIATEVLNFLLSVVGVLAIIMLVVGGIMYLTAAGDEDRIDTGKKIVKYSIIGIFVALAALVMVTQIAAFFV